MRKARNKKLSLLIALVFAFTVIFPMGAAFADTTYVSFSQGYNYVIADDEVDDAGVATATYKAAGDAATVYFELTLPDDVEFTSKPTTADNIGPGEFVDDVTLESSSGTSVKVSKSIANFQATPVKFDFSKLSLDIDDDFTGNLDVSLEVTGVDGNGKIVWVESDDMTIAKVAEGSKASVEAKDPLFVSAGGNRKAAKITVTEPKADLFDIYDDNGTPNDDTDDTDATVVKFEIKTSGVTFGDDSELAANNAFTRVNSNTYGINNSDSQVYEVEITTASTTFPGKIEFTPYLNVAPSVAGDIKITVTGNNDKVKKTTVVVATVGDAIAEVDEVEDNDKTAYAGKITEMDAEITITTADEFKDGDVMTFELSNGKFVEPDNIEISTGEEAVLYSKDKAFYVTFDGGEDEFKVSGMKVKVDNDAEPGDLTLTIGGDYGDLGEVVIGTVAKPFTVSAEKTPIISEALNQDVADIIITEAADGVLKIGDKIHLELPSGVELNGKPKVDVTEGNGDASIEVEDDEVIILEITEESSDPSTFKVHNISYDAGRLALYGDVVVDVYLQDTDIADADFDRDTVMVSVANATVANENEVTATFSVGDEGVKVINGRTLVQVNLLCDTLGMQKSWDEVNKTAYFVLNGKVVAFPMGENAIYINGTKLAVDQGGMIIDNYTYATLRGIQMAFGGELSWDDETKTAEFKFNK